MQVSHCQSTSGSVEQEAIQTYMDRHDVSVEHADFLIGTIVEYEILGEQAMLNVVLPNGASQLLLVYTTEAQLQEILNRELVFEVTRPVGEEIQEVFGYEPIELLLTQAPPACPEKSYDANILNEHDLTLAEGEMLILAVVKEAERSQDGLCLLVEEEDGNMYLLHYLQDENPEGFLGRRILFVADSDSTDDVRLVNRHVPLQQQFRQPDPDRCVLDLRHGLESLLTVWDEWEAKDADERGPAPRSLQRLGLEPRPYLYHWLSDLREWCLEPNASQDRIANLYAATGLGKTAFLTLLAEVLPRDAQLITTSNSLSNVSQIAGAFRRIESNITHACSRDIPYARRGSDGRIHLMSHAATDLDRDVVKGGVIELREQLIPSYVFVDEMDLINERYMELIERWRQQGAIVLGVSATRDHLTNKLPRQTKPLGECEVDGRQMYILRLGENYFGKTFSHLPLGEAISRGYLPEPQTRTVASLFSASFLNGDSLGDDWDTFKEFLWARISDQEVENEVSFVASSGNRRFRPLGIRVSTQDRARDLALFLSAKGLPTETLIGDTPDAARSYFTSEIGKENGELHALVGVHVIGRGTDTAIEWIIDTVCSHRIHDVVQFIGRCNRARVDRVTTRPPLMWQIEPAGSNNQYITHSQALEFSGLSEEQTESLILADVPMDELSRDLYRPQGKPVVSLRYPEDTLLNAYQHVNAELGDAGITWQDFLNLLEHHGEAKLVLPYRGKRSFDAHVDISHLPLDWSAEDWLHDEMEALKFLAADTAQTSYQNRVHLENLVATVREFREYELSEKWLSVEQIRSLFTNNRDVFYASEIFFSEYSGGWDEHHDTFETFALHLEELLENTVTDLVSEIPFSNRDTFVYEPPVKFARFEGTYFYNIRVWKKLGEELGFT